MEAYLWSYLAAMGSTAEFLLSNFTQKVDKSNLKSNN